VDAAVIDRIAARVAHAVTSGEAVAPIALRLLLRRFIASGEEYREPLALALGADADIRDTPDPERLLLLADALQVSDDAWIRDALSRQATEMAAVWPSRGAVADAVRTVDSCLAAGAALGAEALIISAIDELERVVSIAYEPGDGVAQTLSTRTRSTGDLATHVATAAALLTAYDVANRPAYPMLAEELMRTALAEATGGPPSLALLEGARVLARLVSLQRDADYRAVAITREDSDYQRVAEGWLGGVDVDEALPLPLAAVYALAVDDWLRLT
jgi:hypothetical protein